MAITTYIPDKLPLEKLNYEKLFSLTGRANAELARYDGVAAGHSNPQVLLSPFALQKAVLSSRIEGTQATANEVLEREARLTKEGTKYKDIQEIINYRLALDYGRDYLKDYPIRLHCFRELHKILMDNVRGRNKQPGVFRSVQNWIGPQGCTIESATFVPP